VHLQLKKTADHLISTRSLNPLMPDDLIRRAKVATAQGMRQKLVRFGTPRF
jgi:hypothetical protein